jgi:hypothetical protein
MRKFVILLACLTAAVASHADQLGASIRALIEAHENIVRISQPSCKDGDSIACDKVLVSQARIVLLQLELRHRSGKVHEALDDVDTAMSDLEDAVDDE